MKMEEIIKTLTEDQKEGNGEILSQSEDSILYYDYDFGKEIRFRSEEICTLENLVNVIRIGNIAQSHGLTDRFVANMLKEAYHKGTEFVDIMTTLDGVYIVSSKEEFDAAVTEILTENGQDDSVELYIEDGFSWYKFKDMCGQLFFEFNCAFINESTMWKLAKEMADEVIGFSEEYCRGMVQSIIHEVRHCMLNTNLFLPEDIYPAGLETEDKVEEFCRERSEHLTEYTEWEVLNIPEDVKYK